MSEATVIDLPSSLDIAHCAALKATLDKALASDAKAFQCNPAAVQRIDGAGMQLLLAAVSDCQRTEREWQWTEANDSLSDAASGLGLASVLQIQPSEN